MVYDPDECVYIYLCIYTPGSVILGPNCNRLLLRLSKEDRAGDDLLGPKYAQRAGAGQQLWNHWTRLV